MILKARDQDVVALPSPSQTTQAGLLSSSLSTVIANGWRRDGVHEGQGRLTMRAEYRWNE